MCAARSFSSLCHTLSSTQITLLSPMHTHTHTGTHLRRNPPCHALHWTATRQSNSTGSNLPSFLHSRQQTHDGSCGHDRRVCVGCHAQQGQGAMRSVCHKALLLTCTRAETCMPMQLIHLLSSLISSVSVVLFYMQVDSSYLHKSGNWAEQQALLPALMDRWVWGFVSCE